MSYNAPLSAELKPKSNAVIKNDGERRRNHRVRILEVLLALSLIAAIFTHAMEDTRVYNEYSSLKERYESLLTQYRELEENYNGMELNYRALEEQHNHLRTVATKLNNTLADLADTTMKHCCLPYAFERVLTLNEVNAIASYVREAGVHSNDFWSSLNNIYFWVRWNVKYVHDVDMPVLSYPSCDQQTRLCNYQVVFYRDYVQTPMFTAMYGQGDCDDQAILIYAMIRYYMIYIYGTDYKLWLAIIRLNDGSGHAAVFLPVREGKLTIIDPAGGYLTSTWWGYITSKPVYSELVSYSNHWRNSGGIKHIILYEVNIYTGEYKIVASGDISSISSYIILTS